MSENIYAMHGLRRKRGELAGQILTLEQQLKTLRADMAALDRSLVLLDPSIEPATIKPIKPVQRFKYFRAGELPRIILDILRAEQEPILNYLLVEKVMKAKALDQAHRDTRRAVESRVRSGLERLKDKGIVRRIGKNRGSQWVMSDR